MAGHVLRRHNDRVVMGWGEMNIEERARLSLKFICPILVIIEPYFMYVLWKVPNPPGPDHLGWQWYVGIYVLCGGGWLYALWYCLKKWKIIRRPKN